MVADLVERTFDLMKPQRESQAPRMSPCKRCPACGGRMFAQKNFGLTGTAYVCQRCVTSLTI